MAEEETRVAAGDGSKEAAPTVPGFRSRRELFFFAFHRIRETRRYWLVPVLLFLIGVGLFLNLFTRYNVLPAIYSLIP